MRRTLSVFLFLVFLSTVVHVSSQPPYSPCEQIVIELMRLDYELDVLEGKETKWANRVAYWEHVIELAGADVTIGAYIALGVSNYHLSETRKKIAKVNKKIKQLEADLKRCNENESGSGGGG